jgi:hypothetical protein
MESEERKAKLPTCLVTLLLIPFCETIDQTVTGCLRSLLSSVEFLVENLVSWLKIRGALLIVIGHRGHPANFGSIPLPAFATSITPGPTFPNYFQYLRGGTAVGRSFLLSLIAL